MRKKTLIALVINSWLPVTVGRQAELPRRLENPAPVILAEGARIEFKVYEAACLGKQSRYSVFLPPSYGEDGSELYPVVYFLHGMWNDHTSWTVDRYGGIPSRLEKLMVSGRLPEFLVVNPDGENSFYTDRLDGSLKYEQLVYRDLIGEVECHYRVLAERRFRSIGGVSMGGYGSLKIAFKHPELYASVAGISPIVLAGDDPSVQIMNSNSRMADYLRSSLKPIFGMPFDLQHWRRNSLLQLAGTQNVGDLRILMAYGTADRYDAIFPMEAGVRALSRQLGDRKVDHEFQLYENGPHGWTLLVQHLEEVATFLAQTFR
jgi:S-formylglutathione hydrolase FrmB